MQFVTYSTLGKNGKLANQMFQIAATISYALDTGRDFIFPEWDFSKYMEKQLPTGEVKTDCHHFAPFHYEPIPKLEGSVDLRGHMQSSKYFAHHWSEIKPYLKLKPEHEDRIVNIYWELLSQKTCSIHVRRTDYTTPTNLEYHGVMPVEYYLEGIKRIYGKTNPKDVLFIFYSDDIDWCKRNFSLPEMFFSEVETGLMDLYFMGKCKNNIIANSSYSWWAAYLNENPEKIVVAPKNWFGPACDLDTKDIYEPTWIVI